MLSQGERDRLVARIASGVVRLPVYVGGALRRYEVRPLSWAELADVEEDASLAEDESHDLMGEGELLSFLCEDGLWDEKKEEALAGVPKDIEKLKMGLYEYRLQSAEREATRRMLGLAKKKLAELYAERHSHAHLSRDGYVRLYKARSKLARSLYYQGLPVFPGGSHLQDRTDLLDSALAAWHAAQLEESAYRDLARNNPWRGLWHCREACGSIFGVPAAGLTDEQQQLVAVSQLYDNVRAHPDAPPDFVIDDDDMLDGWLLTQHKKTSQEQDIHDVESSIKNDKIRNSQEVFVVVGDKEQARRVGSLNSPQAARTIQRRGEAIERRGSLTVAELPDMKDHVRMELNRRAAGNPGGGE